jgi:plastocyanin
MRRLVLGILVVAVLAAAVAGVSGAFTSASAGKRGPSASSSAAPQTPVSAAKMPMPTATGGSKAPARIELHRQVVQVTIRNFAFEPARIVVSPGTRIVWRNEDEDPHTVTSDAPSGGLSSPALETGSRFATVLKQVGTITYHCTIHPYMHGAVVVQG